MATRFTTALDVDGLRVEANIPRNSSAWQLANSVFCPLGPSPTRAWLAVTKQTLDQVVALDAAGNSHTINWYQYLTTEDGGTPTETKTLSYNGMYLVGAERVLQGAPDDSNALFLAEFADGRYVANKKSDTGNITVNLRSYANSTDYLTGTSGYTWNTLIEALWNACGVLGTYPSLPGTLPVDGAPQNHWFIGHNAYRSLCVVLDYLDCAIRHNPFAAVGGQYSIIQLGASQTLASNTDSLKWNGQPQTGIPAHVASSVKVYFHYHRKGYGQERDTELANNWAYNGAGTTITVATGVTGSVGTLPLWDDLPAIIDESGNQSNAADCTTRANNRNSRYVTRNSITYRHRIHRGLFATDYLPGGQVKAVLWRNWGDGLNPDGTSNAFGGTCTEFVCTRELVHGFKVDKVNPNNTVSWLDRNNDTPEWNQYSGLDLGKHSYPTYPRLPNIVEVNHVGTATGTTVYPYGSYGLHRGRVRRWVNNELAILDDCWILFVDEYDTKQGTIPAKQGDCFGPARLSGITTDTHEGGEATLPVYTVRKGSVGGTGEIVVFELSEALEQGTTETASAYLCVLGAGVWTADTDQAITVACGYSSIGRLWKGPVGAKGLAYQRLDGVYEIIYMLRYDMFVKFVAAETRSIGQNSFSVTIVEGFQHGDLNGDNQAVVYDPYGIFPRVTDQCNGIAVWDDENDRYQCIFVEQAATMAKATINNATIGIQLGQDTDIPVNNFTVISPPPFAANPVPIPDTARNLYQFRGKDGDEVLLVWDDASLEWIIAQISCREKSYVVKPVNDIEKGATGDCVIYINGVATTEIIQCKALGAKVFSNKWCSAWTEPSTGVVYVAPWEC